MKKIFYKISSILTMVVLLASSVKAQLPLKYGDLAVTYRYGMVTNNSNNSYTTTNSVLAVLRTSNTSGANPGEVWTLPGYGGGSQNKPKWYSDPRWTQANLGDIFGITIDNYGNIYVSSTSIYFGTNSPKIYKIDGSTGNISMITFPALKGSFGNIKFQIIGANSYLYLSDWGNGLIHRLINTGNVNSATAWVYGSSFNPEFGRTVHSTDDYAHGQLAYGLGIRTVANTKALYYSRIGNGGGRNYTSITAMSNGYQNDVWSVQLNATTGDFVTGSETAQALPGGVFQFNTAIADIAFTNDGKRMLLGQQSLRTLSRLDAHQSEVAEFVQSTANNWVSSGKLFPTGNYLGSGTQIQQSSAVGGISYSNNILYGNETKLGCDTTVWAVTDFMYNGSGVGSIPIIPSTCLSTYGLQGYTNQGIQPYSSSYTTFQNSLLIDEDDDYGTGTIDKYFLGDVEVYNKPLDCNIPACSCGKWQSNPTLNGSPIPGVPIIWHVIDDGTAQNKSLLTATNTGTVGPPPLIQDYPIQFVKGNVSGVINAAYQCSGNCGAIYSWSITNNANSAVINSGTTLPIDLAKYNNLLQCGNYTLTINAQCGNSKCGGLTIPITIICEPPGCCTAKITVDLKSSSVNAVTNIANPTGFSTANLNYTLNYNIPMSEVRVSVEEFKLVANSPNCLTCSKPVNWGNVIGANLNGTAMALSGTAGTPPGSLAAEVDYREAVYNTGTPLAPSSAGLNIRLSLPLITELSCCEVSAYVCLKFTFKDTQCRECVQMVCGQIKLVAPNTNGGTTDGTATQKMEIKKFDVNH